MQQTADHQRRLYAESIDCMENRVKTNAFAIVNASTNQSRPRTVLFWLSCHSEFQCVTSTCEHLCDRNQFEVFHSSIFVATNENCCIEIEKMARKQTVQNKITERPTADKNRTNARKRNPSTAENVGGDVSEPQTKRVRGNRTRNRGDRDEPSPTIGTRPNDSQNCFKNNLFTSIFA